MTDISFYKIVHKGNKMIYDYIDYKSSIRNKLKYCVSDFFFRYDVCENGDRSLFLIMIIKTKNGFIIFPNSLAKSGFNVEKIYVSPDIKELIIKNTIDFSTLFDVVFFSENKIYLTQEEIIDNELNKIKQDNLSHPLIRGSNVYSSIQNLSGKNIMFLDLETTGLPRTSLNSKTDITDLKSFDSSRIIQIGYSFFESADFNRLDKSSAKSVLIKPDNFKIPKITTDIHGITDSMASKGIGFDSLISHDFCKVLAKTDYIIAYNAWFDVCILQSEFHRYSNPLLQKIRSIIDSNSVLCLAELSKILCPPVSFKSVSNRIPKQRDVYLRCFNVLPENQHDAKGDVIAMIDIMNFMVENKLDEYFDAENPALIDFNETDIKTDIKKIEISLSI